MRMMGNHTSPHMLLSEVCFFSIRFYSYLFLISLFLSGSGAIEFDEFVKMYRTLRTKPMDCSKTIRALFCKLDTDNDGHLGFR